MTLVFTPMNSWMKEKKMGMMLSSSIFWIIKSSTKIKLIQINLIIIINTETITMIIMMMMTNKKIIKCFRNLKDKVKIIQASIISMKMMMRMTRIINNFIQIILGKKIIYLVHKVLL